MVACTLVTFLPDEELLEAAVDDGVRGVVGVHHLVIGLAPPITAANLHDQLSSPVIACEPRTSPHTLITFSS